MKWKALLLLVTIVAQSELVSSQSHWHPFVVDKDWKIAERNPTDWSYPWYMIQHQDGHFENTRSDSISSRDTIKIIHNSDCYSYLNNKTGDFNIDSPDPISRLKFCEAILQNDTLRINLYDQSASNNEKVEIRIVDGQYQLEYKIAYVFPYDKILIVYLNQNLILNQSSFKVGNELTGDLNLKLMETILFDSGKKSNPIYKEIKGSFGLKIN